MTRKPSLSELFEPGNIGRPPELQVRMYEALKSGKDVSIDDLFDLVVPVESRASYEHAKQQRLGPPITKLNRRLKSYNYGIRPGRTRGTYALVSLS